MWLFIYRSTFGILRVIRVYFYQLFFWSPCIYIYICIHIYACVMNTIHCGVRHTVTMLDQIISSHLAVGQFIVRGRVASNRVVSFFSPVFASNTVVQMRLCGIVANIGRRASSTFNVKRTVTTCWNTLNIGKIKFTKHVDANHKFRKIKQFILLHIVI